MSETPEAFIPSLRDTEVTSLLEQDAVGARFLATEPDPGERRWLLFELFRARPAWFAKVVEHIAAVRRSEASQLALL